MLPASSCLLHTSPRSKIRCLFFIFDPAVHALWVFCSRYDSLYYIPSVQCLTVHICQAFRPGVSPLMSPPNLTLSDIAWTFFCQSLLSWLVAVSTELVRLDFKVTFQNMTFDLILNKISGNDDQEACYKLKCHSKEKFTYLAFLERATAVCAAKYEMWNDVWSINILLGSTKPDVDICDIH